MTTRYPKRGSVVDHTVPNDYLDDVRNEQLARTRRELGSVPSAFHRAAFFSLEPRMRPSEVGRGPASSRAMPRSLDRDPDGSQFEQDEVLLGYNHPDCRRQDDDIQPIKGYSSDTIRPNKPDFNQCKPHWNDGEPQEYC